MKVLIVEDTLPAALGAKAVLGAFKADVSIADSGKKALELAVQPFDIILMDIGLPDTDGFKLTREIHEPKKSSSPHLPHKMQLIYQAHF